MMEELYHIILQYSLFLSRTKNTHMKQVHRLCRRIQQEEQVPTGLHVRHLAYLHAYETKCCSRAELFDIASDSPVDLRLLAFSAQLHESYKRYSRLVKNLRLVAEKYNGIKHQWA